VIRKIFVLSVCLLAAAPAGAAIVYSQTPHQVNGLVSDFAETAGLHQQADNFQLATGATLQGIEFWGNIANPSLPDDFIIRIFADAAGAPTSTPLAQSQIARLIRTPTGEFSTAGNPVFGYVANFATPIALAASTRYYLSVVNNTSDDSSWNWSRFDGTADNARWHRAGDAASTDPWLETTQDLAFVIYDTNVVPAPAPVALIALGVFGLVRARRAQEAAVA
jgi:hypothetical protein